MLLIPIADQGATEVHQAQRDALGGQHGISGCYPGVVVADHVIHACDAQAWIGHSFRAADLRIHAQREHDGEVRAFLITLADHVERTSTPSENL